MITSHCTKYNINVRGSINATTSTCIQMISATAGVSVDNFRGACIDRLNRPLSLPLARSLSLSIFA